MSDHFVYPPCVPLLRSTRSFVLPVLALLLNAVLLHGQSYFDSDPQSHPEANPQTLELLLHRIEQLESDDQQLQTRVAQLERIKAVAPTSASTSDLESHRESGPQTLDMLLHRIEQLESDHQQLRTRVAELEKIEAVATTPASSSGLAENPADRGPVLASAQAQITPPRTTSTHVAGSAAAHANAQNDVHDSDHMDLNKTLLNIRGFGDFGLYGGNQKGETTTFSLGQLNLFITSDISERFKVLTELVFEVHQNNDFEEDLERILLTYSLNDYFKLSAGRYHTAIGYYNTAFHHTTWFQTATGRPFIFSYEDEGGILPIHNVGVEASGQIPSGKLGLHYVAEVGNGRASQRNAVEPVQNFVDENNHKSINLALFAQPEAIPGAQVGFSIYRDVLYPVNSVAIGETIVDAYAIVSRSKFEWLNEGLVIRHTPRGMHGFETPAFYSQISRRFGIVRPYLRYEYINASSNEPVFPQVGLRTGPTAGLRFDVNNAVAIKAQYSYTELRRQTEIDGKICQAVSLCAPSSIALQVGYTF
jgi:hypothetical protein